MGKLKQSLFQRYPHLRQSHLALRHLRNVACVVGVLFLGGGLIALGIHMGLNKNDWASWVQAVGSIAAIIGAWLIGHRQAQHAYMFARRLRYEEHSQRIRALLPIAQRAWELIQTLDDEPLEDYFGQQYSPDDFRGCLQALEAIPLHELGAYGLVEGFLDLQKALRAADVAAQHIARVGVADFASRFNARAADHHISQARLTAEQAMQQIKANQVPKLGPDLH